MLIKKGNWYKGDLKFKRAGQGWVEPKTSFLKKGGVWVPIQGTQLLSWDLSNLIDINSEWTYDVTRGWYRNVHSPAAGSMIAVKLSQEQLSKIRQISGVFYSEFNAITNSMGTNFIRVYLDDGTYHFIGTNDQGLSGRDGQTLFRGDLGTSHKETINVLGARWTYTVPEGRTIVSMDVASYGRDDSGTLRPFTPRGMKDFQVTLRH